ncbi:putative DNA primase/helicase [Butyrivibrio sp. YAB3001]|nr:putative DNA primase/helicase [Butyrivibrio sp. YAB3001]
MLEAEEAASGDCPVWFDVKTHSIDEVEYCAWFMGKHPIKFVGGIFYDIDGLLSEEKLRKEIVDDLKPYVKTAIVRKANQILDALRYEALCDTLPRHTDRVHFKNGTYYLDGGFVPEKEFCCNRLPINYNPDAKEPKVWLKFLEQLLYPEDIATLQEFMGYAFIPTTKAQVMLMLIGSGGEGKSRVGFMERNLLGDNMNVCSISKLSTDRFSAADQEGKLLMIDDDTKTEALTDTGLLKSIVTMEDKMDLERKGKQSYQGYLYVRIMVFGNGTLNSLYDKTDGFYRRQIVLRVKEKPADRIDDRELSEKLALETEGVALWALEGLKRLVKNGFHFTISERTKQNQAEMRRDEDSIMDFFDSEGYVTFDEEALCSTKDLYEAYRLWGEDNLVKVRSESSFSKELRQRADKLGLTYMKNVSIDGKTSRGYKGLYAKHAIKDVPFYGRKGA